MFKQYQQVKLQLESLEETFFGETVKLQKGQHGVVLDVLAKSGFPNGYNVEFFDEAGETIAVTTLEDKDLAPLTDALPSNDQEVA